MEPLKLYNTLTRQKEIFKPIKGKKVGLYTCGPTVYDFAHIGNLRTYIFEDILKRALLYNGYKIKHAMNVTDVGHLVGDSDGGEDKIEVGARREGKDPLAIARRYETQFFKDLAELNILPPNKVLRATETIAEQQKIIKKLLARGLAYQTPAAIYFDTGKFKDYGRLAGQNLAEKTLAARSEVVSDADKRNPADFALWFFLTGRYKNHILHWPSKWGEGFPGWHIECSAISRKILGQPFDIHCGGVDHIGTHHPNEMAQSQAAFDSPLANWWIHGEHLIVDAKRMGKSEGNLLTLAQLSQQSFSPLAFRYLVLQTHYRQQLNFSLPALSASQTALFNLLDTVATYEKPKIGCAEYEEKFLMAINDDLNLPKALAVVWDLIKDQSLPGAAKKQSLLKFDSVLGLNLKPLFPQRFVVWPTSARRRAKPKIIRRPIAYVKRLKSKVIWWKISQRATALKLKENSLWRKKF